MKRTYLTLIIALLVIGFAAVTTNLVFNGTLKIGFNAEDFEVYFSKATLDDVEKSKELISQDGKSISFVSKKLTDIDSTSTLEYEITNNSKQYDAEVEITCTPTDSEYIDVNNELQHTTIVAQSEENGILTVTLKKLTVEEQQEIVKCTLNVKAVSRTSKETQKVEETYSIGAYLYDQEGNILVNKHLVIYSNTPHYVETDNEGYFYIEGLERGIHEIYYLGESVGEGKSKEEIKDIASDSAEITTESKEIVFKDKTVTTKKASIGKESEVIKVTLKSSEQTLTKVVDDNKAEFTINTNNYTTMLCNKKIDLNEDGKIKLSNITEDTECKLYTAIVDAMNEHNEKDEIGTMMMVNDELTVSEDLNVNKQLYFNLNGKTIISSADSSFVNNANASYYDSKNNGKIISTGLDAITIGIPNITVNTSLNTEATRSAVRIYHAGTNSIINVTGGNISCNQTVSELGYSCVFISDNTEIVNITDANIQSDKVGIANYGTVTLNNVNLNAKDSIGISNFGTLNITNGTYEASATLIENRGKLRIEGGKYISKGGFTIYNRDSGETNIYGEEATFDKSNNYISGTYFESTGKDNAVIYQEKGLINIYGGTFFHPNVEGGTWRQHALRAEEGVGNIYGGIFDTLGQQEGNNDLLAPFLTIYLNRAAILNILGGTIRHNILVNATSDINSNNVINICGGTFTGWLATQHNSYNKNYIYYKQSGIKWENETGKIMINSASSSNVIENNSITCKVS